MATDFRITREKNVGGIKNICTKMGDSLKELVLSEMEGLKKENVRS